MQMPPWITKLTQKQIKYIVFVFVLYSVECLSKKDLQVASFSLFLPSTNFFEIQVVPDLGQTQHTSV